MFDDALLLNGIIFVKQLIDITTSKLNKVLFNWNKINCKLNFIFKLSFKRKSNWFIFGSSSTSDKHNFSFALSKIKINQNI